jgi:hypothetical protein
VRSKATSVPAKITRPAIVVIQLSVTARATPDELVDIELSFAGELELTTVGMSCVLVVGVGSKCVSGAARTECDAPASSASATSPPAMAPLMMRAVRRGILPRDLPGLMLPLASKVLIVRERESRPLPHSRSCVRPLKCTPAEVYWAGRVPVNADGTLVPMVSALGFSRERRQRKVRAPLRVYWSDRAN